MNCRGKKVTIHTKTGFFQQIKFDLGKKKIGIPGKKGKKFGMERIKNLSRDSFNKRSSKMKSELFFKV